jgi:tetratricopeptide (TPR) repeat protein
MSLELAAVLAMIVAGIGAIYAIFFGSRPLADVFREHWSRWKQRKQPGARASARVEMTPKGENPAPSDAAKHSDISAGITYFDEIVHDVRQRVSSSKYEEAVRMARRQRERMLTIGDRNSPEFQLALGELDVWYAKALIYTGSTDEAMGLLERVIAGLDGAHQRFAALSSGVKRWNVVLGLAHNHIGYANWMDRGHYQLALREFTTATHHFLVGAHQAELATALDNLGRVCAELGYRTRAELLLEHGKKIRDGLYDEYRYALSLNSSAIAHLAFGQPFRALVESEEALKIFRRQERDLGQRGSGLALITQGRAQRYLGAYQKYSHEKSRFKEYLRQAVTSLKEAEEIFQVVKEDIRLLQVYNELGCVYREQMALGQGREVEAAPQAERYLTQCIKGAEKYPALYIDACEDLARTCFLLGERREAEKWLRQAEEAVPSAYKFARGSEPRTIAPPESVEVFWQELGKLYMLRGEILFDEKQIPTGVPEKGFPQDIERAIECYALAACYFGRFLECLPEPLSRPQLANHRLFVEHLYDRLRLFTAEELQHIEANVLQPLQEAYHLKPAWRDVLYAEPLELLRQVRSPERTK